MNSSRKDYNKTVFRAAAKEFCIVYSQLQILFEEFYLRALANDAQAQLDCFGMSKTAFILKTFFVK